MNDVAYDNIEHIKPKSRFPEMVCLWTNLTSACPRCNTNKGSSWSDECPMLNPYVDAVEEQIAFLGPMALPRGGTRASMTISTLDLNRSELLFSRSEKLMRLDELLTVIYKADRSDERDVVAALCGELRRLIQDDAEFSSASRYFIAARQRELGQSPCPSWQQTPPTPQ